MKLPQGFTRSKSRDCFWGQLLIIAHYGRCVQQFHERNMNHDVTAKNVHNLLLIPFGVIATISAEIWLMKRIQAFFGEGGVKAVEVEAG